MSDDLQPWIFLSGAWVRADRIVAFQPVPKMRHRTRVYVDGASEPVEVSEDVTAIMDRLDAAAKAVRGEDVS